MSVSLLKISTDKCDYPSQPRSKPDPAYCRSLGESMKAIGQQVPIIGYTDAATTRFIVSDGGCRLEGARMCGLPDVLAMDLGKKPTQAELLTAQASIDVHRQHLPAIDRARLWQANIAAHSCTARQMAKELGVSESLVGDYLSLLTLPIEVQEQVNSGSLHMSKACLIAQQEKDPERQRALAGEAKDLTRNALAAKIRRMRQPEHQTSVAKFSSLKCPLPSGCTVVVKGRDLTLESAIEELTDLLKAMKVASQDGIDGTTFSRICRDRAKSSGTSLVHGTGQGRKHKGHRNEPERPAEIGGRNPDIVHANSEFRADIKVTGLAEGIR